MSLENNLLPPNEIEQQSLDEAAMLIQDVSFTYLRRKRSCTNHNKFLKLRNEIHNILFDNKEDISEGIYLRLMNLYKRQFLIINMVDNLLK